MLQITLRGTSRPTTLSPSASLCREPARPPRAVTRHAYLLVILLAVLFSLAPGSARAQCIPAVPISEVTDEQTFDVGNVPVGGSVLTLLQSTSFPSQLGGTSLTQEPEQRVDPGCDFYQVTTHRACDARLTTEVKLSFRPTRLGAQTCDITLHHWSTTTIGNFIFAMTHITLTVHLRGTGIAETVAPACRVTDVQGGSTTRVLFTAQDTGSGLASIQLLGAANATVSIPAFTAGTTAPVVITATKQNAWKEAGVRLKVTDRAGNVRLCEPAILRLGPLPDVDCTKDVPQSHRQITLYNRAPGVKLLGIWVNGRLYGSLGCWDNMVRTLDVASALRAGTNRIVLGGVGFLGYATDVIIQD